LPDDEPWLIKKMLEYLYTLDYQVDDICVEKGSEDAGADPNGDGDDGADGPIAGVFSDPLIFHIAIYALADRLHIQGLKNRSKEYVETELSHRLDEESFPLAITEIYTSTPEHDRGLRDIVIKVTLDNLVAFRKGDGRRPPILQDGHLKQLPQFSYDLAIAMMDKCVSHWSRVGFCYENWSMVELDLDPI
jgi:hypothetical protein